MSSRRLCLALCASLLAARCASAPRVEPPPPVVAAPTPPPPPPEPVADLSPVPAPPGLLATVRIPAPRAMVRRLSQHFGIGEQLVGLLDDSLPEVFNRDEDLARAVNLDEPIDIAVMRGARGEPEVAVAFGAGPYGEVVGRLSEAHTLTVEGVAAQGVRRVERRQGRTMPCAVARSGGGAGTARLVCAERWEQVTPVLDYLTRTLPASPVSREQGEVVVQASSETLRAALRDDVRRATDRLAADSVPRPDPNHAEFEASARAWLQEAVGMLPQLLDDLGAAGVTVTLPDEGLRLSAEVDLARVTSPVARRWLDTLAHPDARTELLARLPPGAMLYTSGSATLEPLRATVNFAAMAASRSLVPVTRMLPTESTALRTAVSALFAQERAGGAAAVGVDEQGRYWNVSLLELSTPGMQFVANARALVAALRRPLVARAIRADHQIDPLRWLLPVVPGLPRGAMLVRIPPGQFLWSGLVRDIAGDMSRQQMEVLLVPDGARVWYVVAPDAVARYRAAAATHEAPVTVASPAGEDVAVAALLPIAASLFFPGDVQFRRNLAGLLQRSPDHGATPLAVRLGLGPQGDGMRVRARVDVPRSVLGIVGQVMSTLQGGRP
jgi:hypothetical protein